MWDIKYLLKDLVRTKSFQEFINNRYSGSTDSDMVVISKKVFKIVGTEYGLFYLDEHWSAMSQVEDYFIEDMLSSDIVLDIGANIGAFSIKTCRKAKHVYAVEPLFDDLTKKNIALNNIKNISVLKTALGSGHLDIAYEGKRIGIPGKSLKELIDMCGGHIDFLKCDCEGGEWIIKAEELKDIRRIEMEYHIFKNVKRTSKEKQTPKPIMKMLDKAGFEYSIDNKRKCSSNFCFTSLYGNIIAVGLIHATCKINGKSTRPYME